MSLVDELPDRPLTIPEAYEFVEELNESTGAETDFFSVPPKGLVPTLLVRRDDGGAEIYGFDVSTGSWELVEESPE